MNPYQKEQARAQQMANDMHAELDKMEMSWSTDLRKWYDYAIQALNNASIVRLQIPGNKYPKLFEKTAHGLNMNVVMVLANNLEQTTPEELKLTAKEFADVISLNNKIGAAWNAMAGPVQKTIQKRYEIMNGAGASKMKIAEA